MTRVALLTPGNRTAIVSDSFVALVDAPMRSSFAVALAQLALEGRGSVEEILDVLLAVPVRDVPGLSIVAVADDTAVALLRGDLGLEVEREGRDVEWLDASGIRTWREVPMPSPSRVSLGGRPDEADASGWLFSGVVPAGAVTWTTLDASSLEVAEAVAADGLQDADPDELTREEGEEGWVAVIEESDDLADMEAPRLEEPEEQEELNDSSGAGSNNPDAEQGSEGSYDHLFSHTRPRTIEQAAVRGHQPEADESLITAVPGDSLSSPPPPVEYGDHDGSTRSLSSIMAEIGGGDPSPAVGGVPASRCQAGHLNPPNAAACRECSEPMLPGIEVVDRPQVGVLILSKGDRVSVDRMVLLGRNPGADLTFEGEPPRLVALANDRHLSRTHCAVEVSGWTVSVVDRGSENGTTVHVPGRAPELLRPGLPTVVLPGTEIILAEAITVRFEAV